jgi:hypothetical protein
VNEAQKSQSVPWSLRERVTPLRTYSGRVVYDRDKHFFTSRDLERIAHKAKSDGKKPKDLSAFSRLLRAIWALYTSGIVPYPSDWDEPIFVLLGKLFVALWTMTGDPLEWIKGLYKEFILSVANIFQIEQWIADTFKSYQTPTESEKE